MPATRQEIESWFSTGKGQGYGYMIVVCDTYDYTDYPVYCNESDFQENYKQIKDQSMQRIMEVYDLGMDQGEQLRERRAYHCPPITL